MLAGAVPAMTEAATHGFRWRELLRSRPPFWAETLHHGNGIRATHWLPWLASRNLRWVMMRLEHQ